MNQEKGSTALLIMVLAAAYLVAGKLSLLLAIPPGYATAVWPPAGIALAFALRYGPRIWPGIWLGSFLANVGTSIDTSSFMAFAGSVAIPGAIAIGAIAQALVGARLVRHFVGTGHPIMEERKLMLFLSLGGPVACLISSNLGVLTLSAAGVLFWSEYVTNSLTWWAGDTLGVIIFAPMVFSIFGQGREKWQRDLATVWAPQFLAFAGAVVLFIVASGWEQARIRHDLDERAARLERSLKRNLDSATESLYSVAGFVASQPGFAPQAFHSFAAQTLARHPSVHGLSLNPIVRHRDRAAFERHARASGHPDFRIRELQADGTLREATERDEYVFPYFLEPWPANQAAFGLNILAETVRGDAIRLARKSGMVSATAKIHLIQSTGGLEGVLALIPVPATRGIPFTSGSVVAAVLDFKELIESAVQASPLDGMSVRLLDLNAPEGLREIYEKGATHDGSAAPVLRRSTFDFAQRQWALETSFTRAYLTTHRSWQAWFALVAGLLFTGLLGVFLLVLTGRTARVEAIVAIKSAQLERHAARLMAASKMSVLGEMAGGIAHEINTPIGVIMTWADKIRRQARRGALDAEAAAVGCDKIVTTVDRISRIIHGLRAFARDAEADPMQPASVQSVIRDALELVQEKLRFHGVEVVLAMPDTDIVVSCRPAQLSQVILNLLSNAYDAVLGQPLKRIEITAEATDEWISLRIADSGPGIQAGAKDRIFEPFYTTKDVGKGTGLGLSISKGIVEGHGGMIHLDAERLQTTFVIRLPATQPQVKRKTA